MKDYREKNPVGEWRIRDKVRELEADANTLSEAPSREVTLRRAREGLCSARQSARVAEIVASRAAHA